MTNHDQPRGLAAQAVATIVLFALAGLALYAGVDYATRGVIV